MALVFPVHVTMVAVMILPVAGPIAVAGWYLRRVSTVSDAITGRIVFGAVLGALTYLIWAALGVGEPSGVPTTFIENMSQRFQWIVRMPAASFGGVAGWLLFRHLATSDPAIHT